MTSLEKGKKKRNIISPISLLNIFLSSFYDSLHMRYLFHTQLFNDLKEIRKRGKDYRKTRMKAFKTRIIKKIKISKENDSKRERESEKERD